MYEEFWCTYVHPTEGWVIGQPNTLLTSNPRDTLRLNFHPETGQVEARMLAGSAINLNAVGHHTILSASIYAQAATLLCQRGVHHPSEYGFVWRGTARDRAVCDALQGRQDSPVLQRTSLNREFFIYGGWFPPDAAPNVFGTLFLGRVRREENTALHSVWQLRAVGLPDVFDEARWDDGEGCARLRGKAADAGMRDSLLVQAALTYPPAQFKIFRDGAVKREVSLAARDAFSRPRDRVKPRRVMEVAAAVKKEMFREGKIPNAIFANSVQTVSLNSSHFEGSLAPINIAVKVQPVGGRERVHSDGVLSEWAWRIQASLDDEKLGQLLRHRCGDGSFEYLVVKNPALVVAYAAALDIGQDVPVEVCAGGDGRGGARWERV